MIPIFSGFVPRASMSLKSSFLRQICPNICFYLFFFLRYQVDPFLHLVDDCKLKAVDPGSEPPKIIYGSKEDDNSALISLSEIEITVDQTKESLASLILNSLVNLPDVNPPSILISYTFMVFFCLIYIAMMHNHKY